MRRVAAITSLGLLVALIAPMGCAIRQYAGGIDPSKERTVSRSHLGVLLQDINEELRTRLRVPPSRGVLVARVDKDTAAEKAGIMVNDVIIRFNGQDVTALQLADEHLSAHNLLRLRIAATEPGTMVDVVVLRDGREQTLSLTLGARREVLPSLNKALHEAIDDNRFAEVQAALNQGADVNCRDSGGMTPLAVAARYGRLKIVKLLLDKGADINAADNSGNTPLMLAAKSSWAKNRGGRYAEVVALLLAKGARVNAQDEKGFTALDWAIASDSELDRVAMVKLLLANGANVNAVSSFGSTALISASQKGETEIVRLLLERGADVTYQDRGGFNALHYAKRGGQGSIWEQDRVATGEGHKETVQLLLAKGAEEARRMLDRSRAIVARAVSPDDYDRAIKELEPAIRLAPHMPEPYYNLALLQEKRGQYAAAMDNLKQYMRVAPNAGDIERVKSLINTLEYTHEQDLRARTFHIDGYPVRVAGVRFFEGGGNGVPLPDRVYTTRYSRNRTRFVFWELKLEHPISLGPRDCTIESVWFNPMGQEIFRHKSASGIGRAWDHSFHDRGYGWQNAASAMWSAGTYRVELYVDGKRIAAGEFVME